MNNLSLRDILSGNNDWWFGDYFREFEFRRTHYYQIRNLIKKGEPLSILFLGMRRTGKTVILKQLVSDICEGYGNIAAYIPVDELALRVSESPIVNSVDWFLRNIHPGGKPIIIALDEAQYYDNWSLEVKVIYDRLIHKTGVFFIISGSSSLGLILGAGEGLVGRSKIVRIYPMGLLEIVGLLRQDPKISEYSASLIKSYYKNMTSGKIGELEGLMDEILIRFRVSDADIDRALTIMIINGSLPQTIEMIRKNTSRSEVWERLLEIIDLTIMRDILRLLKKYPSKYDLDPIEAQSIFHIITYNSPHLTSVNAISTKLGISWKKVDLALKLGSLAGIIGIANNYAKSPEIRERKRIKKYFIMDVGLRNAVRHRLDPRRITDEEQGQILENIMHMQLQKITHILGDPNPQTYFWRMNNKEIDCVTILPNRLIGVEIKRKKRKSHLRDFSNYAGRNTRTYLIDREKMKEWLIL